MMQRLDLRVIKTRKNIRESFIRLLGEKSFSAITVQNILDEALINRTTFYRHYDSKYALVEELNGEIMERFERLLSSSLQGRDDPEQLLHSVGKMADTFRSDREMVSALWNVRDEGFDLYGEMEQLMRQKFRSFLETTSSEEDNLDYQTTVMTALILNTFRYLLESEEDHTVKELTLQVQRLMKKHLLKVRG